MKRRQLAKMGSVLGYAHFYIAIFAMLGKIASWIDHYALNMLVLRIM